MSQDCSIQTFANLTIALTDPELLEALYRYVGSLKRYAGIDLCRRVYVVMVSSGGNLKPQMPRLHMQSPLSHKVEKTWALNYKILFLLLNIENVQPSDPVNSEPSTLNTEPYNPHPSLLKRVARRQGTHSSATLCILCCPLR